MDARTETTETVTTEPVNGWHWPEWGSEAAGTALLLFAVVTAKDLLVRAGPPWSELWLKVAIVGAVAGLAVVAIAFSPLGRRSGAHLNPAVTFGLALQGGISAADLAGYALSQLAGGVAGVALARIWGPTVSAPPVSWAVIAPASWLGTGYAVLIEAGATFVMLAAVYACLVSERWVRWTAVVAAVLLTAAIAGLAPISGAGFNPVRGLAPDMVAGVYPAVWIYFAGPLVGAALAAVAVERGGRRLATAKLVHDPSIPCYVRCSLPHFEPTTTGAPLAVAPARR